MNTEFAANSALECAALERARWAAVLEPAAKSITQRRAVRKSLIARLLGL
jgi:hypothetical protein